MCCLGKYIFSKRKKKKNQDKKTNKETYFAWLFADNLHLCFEGSCFLCHLYVFYIAYYEFIYVGLIFPDQSNLNKYGKCIHIYKCKQTQLSEQINSYLH